MELPTHNKEVSSLQFGPTFSSAEVRRYRVRLEGYDLHDNRYAQWLSTLPTLHCNSATEDHGSSSKSGFAPKQLSTLEKILHVSTPPAQRKSTKYAKSDRVLASEECMREAQEKEERKKQKEEDKRKKAEERQRKAEERKKKKRKKADGKQKDAAEKRKKTDGKQKDAAENRTKADEKQKEAAQKQNQEGTKNVSRKEGKERKEEKGSQKGTRTLKNIQEGILLVGTAGSSIISILKICP